MERDHIKFTTWEPKIDQRVDALFQRMTLQEKIGQLCQVDMQWCGDLEPSVREGRLGSVFSIHDTDKINRLQRIAVEEGRLGIPLLIGNDVIHGYRTTFPIPLAESRTWDLDLVERAARIAAEEAAACGTNWIFAPMVDVCRDARWGRIAEGSGEDPFLGATLARARVRGFQSSALSGGRKIVACPKHYVGYGAVEAGRDYNTVDLSERTLRDIETLIAHFLNVSWGPVVPPGEAARPTEGSKGIQSYYLISDGSPLPYRVRSRMPSFPHIQMVPHISRGHLVSDLLSILGSIDFVLGEVDR